MVKKRLPQILATKKIAQGNIFSIEQVDLEFSNGEKRIYEIARPRGETAVMAIPMIDADTFLLIREYGAALQDYHLSFPKGLMHQGEDPLLAANREMMEEIGYGANKLTLLKTMTAVPGYVPGVMFCILAEDLYPQSLPGDEPEPLEVVPWPKNKIADLLKRSDFSEGRSIAALMLLMNHYTSFETRFCEKS